MVKEKVMEGSIVSSLGNWVADVNREFKRRNEFG